MGLVYANQTMAAAFSDAQPQNGTDAAAAHRPNLTSVAFTSNEANADGDIFNDDPSAVCPMTAKTRYASALGIELAIPQWQAILVTVVLGIIVIVTIVGNTLVILSVFTYKPLRIVQNFFIVSLAVADLTVAILVLPFNVANMVLGRWVFGINLCKMWLTSDVLCCTSSILNLCAIALDRYWAITDPINYAQKRTVERVLMLIVAVWALSLVISSPPLIGWNDWPEEFDSELHPCALNSNPGYRVYSALGSFYIPLIIMSIVYIEIFLATRRRLRERANATRINAGHVHPFVASAAAATRVTERPAVGAVGGDGAVRASTPRVHQHDQDSISSETNYNVQPVVCEETAFQQPDVALQRPNDIPNVSSNLLELPECKQPNEKSRKESCSDYLEQSSESAFKQLAAEDAPVVMEKSPTKRSDTTPSAELPAVRTIMKPAKHSTVYQFIEEKQKISLSKERRAARTLGIIMGVFIACWVPFFLLYIIQPFCASCCPSDQLIDFLTWLGYINSALNPIIYTIFNLDYRRAFKKLLGIKF